MDLREERRLNFVDDTDIDGELFLRLLARHRLGDGETECIALAMVEDFGICCDDRRARDIARSLIGSERVIGTIRLLRWCVEDALTKCDQAFSLFREMRLQGGFLPETEQAFFCRDGA
jgi:predicted nucleic acid-binding protein